MQTISFKKLNKEKSVKKCKDRFKENSLQRKRSHNSISDSIV